jgi:hypothetical protein
VTEVVPVNTFYKVEEYHLQFYEKKEAALATFDQTSYRETFEDSLRADKGLVITIVAAKPNHAKGKILPDSDGIYRFSGIGV